MNNLLEINNLSKSFNKFSLKSISFNVPKGYITGFIGPNGAGKTTTIKSLLGMTLYDSGKVKVFDKTIDNFHGEYKEDIGIVMDNTFYSKSWSVKEVETAVAPFYSNWNHDTFIKYITEFNLDINKKVSELSKGMTVKLMIAVALSHNARLLILDEPTSGLDPVARYELMDILQSFIEDGERSVFFSTHITEDLNKVADFIVFIKEGSIVFNGEKDVFKESYLIIKGGIGELTQEERNLITGYEEHSTHFDGLINACDKEHFSNIFVFENPTIDDIIVYLYREVK